MKKFLALRKRSRMIGLSIVLAVLVVAPFAVNSFRPSIGYRSALAAFVVDLLDPHIPPLPPNVLGIRDIQARKVDFAVDFEGLAYRGNTQNLIDAHIYYYGSWEKSELYFMRDSIGPESIVIDVGASTGVFSAFASKYAKQVHAVEPYPPALVRLRGLVGENNIKNIIVHPVGLGATEAELPFFAPPENNLGFASFVPGFVPDRKDAQLKLKIVRGDDYFRKLGRVDFIKMDIEGYEKPALAGLKETLRRHRPIVLMELSIDPALPGLFKGLDELKAAFPEHYEILRLDKRDYRSGVYKLPPFNPSFDKQVQFNIVARPQ